MARQNRPPISKSLDDWQIVLLVIAGVLAFFGVGSVITWHGPDPSQVIRASSPDVPSFSHLSATEAVKELRRITETQSTSMNLKALKLSETGQLQIELKSQDSDYTSTRVLLLPELDSFLYAEQAVKGKRIWSIGIYCANYQPCITGSDNRTAGEFKLNSERIIYLHSNADVRAVLGLLNRLLELHNAQSTINTRKNTIRISEEHWRKSTDN